MAVGLNGLPVLYPIAGVRLGVASAGIKKSGRADLTVVELDDGCECAAVFTRNAFCAAPVIVARQHLSCAVPNYLLINTGNANAGTGILGRRDAEASCAALAQLAGCGSEQVLPFSTGVIGEPLPLERLKEGLPIAYNALDDNGWATAATAIMTTDTVPKGASRRVSIGDELITVTGIAKGSGMIRPDMATMLAFVATDARVPPQLLRVCLKRAVAASFNRITVDGDTSTNDACVLIASGRSGMNFSCESPEFEVLCHAVGAVCEELACNIVRDGEGATKLITIEVSEGMDESECSLVAYAIAHSPLVKTAFFASDPNWGRILAAVGRAGVDDLDINRLVIFIDELCIVRDGGRSPEYNEDDGREVMQRNEITVRVMLRRGKASMRVWTCDFSYDYVKINAEYRT